MRFSRRLIVSCLQAALLLFHLSFSLAFSFPKEAPLPGPQSLYSPLLLQLHRQGVLKNIHYPRAQDNPPLQVKCLETPGSEFYVGLQQLMAISAPLKAVEEVVSDLNHYADLFSGFQKIEIIQKEDNLWTSDWEQIVPIFFIPNIKYQMFYLVDQSLPQRIVYRYKLKESDSLRTFDGLIILESLTDHETRYTEYDFYDADYGPLTFLAPGRIWKDGVQGFIQSDFAIKLKAEHPDWSYSKIKQQAASLTEAFPLDEVLKQREQFFLLPSSIVHK